MMKLKLLVSELRVELQNARKLLLKKKVLHSKQSHLIEHAIQDLMNVNLDVKHMILAIPYYIWLRNQEYELSSSTSRL